MRQHERGPLPITNDANSSLVLEHQGHIAHERKEQARLYQQCKKLTCPPALFEEEAEDYEHEAASRPSAHVLEAMPAIELAQ
jgi:hypothetical protein